MSGWQLLLSSVISAIVALSVRVFTVAGERAKYRAEAELTSAQAKAVDIEMAHKWVIEARNAAEQAAQRADRADKRADDAEAAVAACISRSRALEDHVDRLERIMRNANLDPPRFVWPVSLPPPKPRDS